jgi:hypothetical protein
VPSENAEKAAAEGGEASLEAFSTFRMGSMRSLAEEVANSPMEMATDAVNSVGKAAEIARLSLNLENGTERVLESVSEGSEAV